MYYYCYYYYYTRVLNVQNNYDYMHCLQFTIISLAYFLYLQEFYCVKMCMNVNPETLYYVARCLWTPDHH